MYKSHQMVRPVVNVLDATVGPSFLLLRNQSRCQWLIVGKIILLKGIIDKSMKIVDRPNV